MIALAIPAPPLPEVVDVVFNPTVPAPPPPGASPALLCPVLAKPPALPCPTIPNETVFSGKIFPPPEPPPVVVKDVSDPPPPPVDVIVENTELSPCTPLPLDAPPPLPPPPTVTV